VPRAKLSDDDIERCLRRMRRLAAAAEVMDDRIMHLTLLAAIDETEALLAGEPTILSREDIEAIINRGMN
jgi:hypothetical protein